MHFDLAIFGLGSAGAALADAATRKGYRCIAFDHSSNRYASVRNQGWLHSGALYASINSPFAASIIDKCQRGAQMIREFNQQFRLDAILQNPAMMIFHDIREREASFERIIGHGIDARIIDRASTLLLEPILGDGRYIAGGILTPDFTVDAPNILRALMRRALENGCIYVPLARPNFDDINVSRGGDLWNVEVGRDTPVTAREIVMASGSFIPALASKITSTSIIGTVEKCGVLSVKCKPVNRLIIMRDLVTSLTNIAPFKNGATINLGHLWDVTEDNMDFSLDEAFLEATMGSINRFAPGLIQYCPIEARFYCCQKFNPSTSGDDSASLRSREYYYKSVEEGLHVFYAGKFTQCMVAAIEVVGALEGDINPLASSGDLQGSAVEYIHPGDMAPELLIVEEDGELVVKHWIALP